MVRKFWSNIYPALLNNPNSRCIITSTPNGRNFFFEMWKSAEAKRNKFIPYRIYWYDLPRAEGLEQFKADTIANTSIETWEMGFECSFDTQLKSIFSTPAQKLLRQKQLDFADCWSRDNSGIGYKYDMEFISQDKIQYNLKTDYFLLGIDICEGLDQDSSVAKLKKVVWDTIKKKLVYVSVGIFRDSTISVEDFAEWTMNFSKEFDPHKIKIIVENNTYGGEFFGQVKSLKMNDPNFSWFDNTIFAKFMRKSKEAFDLGIRWDRYNKKVGVKSFSDLTTAEIMQETHWQSIEEYLNFGKNKNGLYSANYGHDDLVMGDVSISHFIKSNNIYATAFLTLAQDDLRALANDEDILIVQKKAEEKRKEENIYTDAGYKLRNHADYVKDPINDEYLMGLCQ